MLPVLGKKAVLEFCMWKEGLIESSYVCPKCGKSMELRERTGMAEKHETEPKDSPRGLVRRSRKYPSQSPTQVQGSNPRPGQGLVVYLFSGSINEHQSCLGI
ncbi:hypothetical protein TNCV_4674711 [Trichonephila clavipes]|nr:hypothetical protein TNCV_4674711 [Trichonephila clavipes]